MADPLHLLPNAISQQPASEYVGYVSHNQPAPGSFTDPMHVVIPDIDEGSYWTINRWPRCQGSTLPAAGDLVYLRFVTSFDGTRQVWCLSW